MDPIANMLTSVKNGSRAGLASVLVPYSKVKFAIAQVLLDQKYIAGYKNRPRKKGSDLLEIELIYAEKDQAARVTEVKRISKPSRRVYMGAKDIRPVRQGHGLLVLSTPKGILSGAQARKELVGGEALFQIW